MILNRTGRRLPRTLLRRAVESTRAKNITLVILKEGEMARLNRRFLKHRGPTDVLAFPPGDVAVCLDVALREAKARGIAWQEELVRYAVHGCLHLRGYDDHKPADRRRMWARQERILASLKPRR